MNIYEGILAVWKDAPDLAALLPPENVWSERRQGPQKYPYAVITLISSIPDFRTSKANTDVELFQIAIYAQRNEEALEIQRVMRDVLRDAKPQADETGTLDLFEKSTGSRTTVEGGVVQAIDQFTAQISTSRRK